MGRKKLFSQSLAAGQLFLLSNVVYSLASVPLALSYLSVEEFGLWAVVMQTANFLLLLDAGFSSGAGRLLIDVKDKRPCKAYGRMVATTFSVLTLASLIALFAGLALSKSLISWMQISPNLSGSAVNLITGQIIIAALTLPARTVGGCLVAYGRIDLLNIAFTLSMVAGLAAMWLAFRAGAGIYSLLWANGVGAAYTVLSTLVYASKRNYLPQEAEVAAPTLKELREVIGLSHNIFLNQIGGMVLNLSQALLLGRFAGLETVAVWSVGSKLYNLILQATDKIVQSAGPICSEMWARNEMQRFDLRIWQLKKLTLLAGSIGAASLIAFNTPFIAIWTSGRIVWDPMCNYFLALLFFLRVFAATESAPIVASKIYKAYRFIPLVEAVVFVGVAIVLVPANGIVGLLAAALVSALTTSIPYVAYREVSRVGRGRYKSGLRLSAWAAACLPPLAAWITRTVVENTNSLLGVATSSALLLFSCGPLLLMTWRQFQELWQAPDSPPNTV